LIISETIVIDVTSALHWFLLFHRLSIEVLEPNHQEWAGKELGAINVAELLSITPESDQSERIVREMSRFASMDRNIERLLKILSLKQITEYIKYPLTFQRLVDVSPETVMSPRWFDPRKPDLKALGLIPNGF
jgi:hypothetical protein